MNVQLKESVEQLKRNNIFVASEISGVGMSVPERVIKNDYFASYLETSDEWIQDRTGIVERRWVEGQVSASELAEPAARIAIERAGLTTSDIDGVVLATVTPDYVFPSTACRLQGRLGISKGFAFDINAVCSGFIYALTVSDSLIRTGQAKNVLVVGVDIYSSIIDKKDRSTCVLFGDGAGAVVLSARKGKEQACSLESLLSTRGVYCSEITADGRGADLLYTAAGTAKPITAESISNGEHFLKMQGREIFKHAVRRLSEVSLSVLDKCSLSVSQVDWFVSHQANKRILLSMAKHLGIDTNKVLVNVDKYGNTSAASLPILLAEASEEGSLKKGDLVLLSAFGGGLTWGAVLLRW